MTITTDFTGTENYAERMGGLEAIHDWWFGAGSFAAAATLGQVRANLNTILVGTTILNRETFATWLAKVNTLNEPTEYAAALTFAESQSGALWQCTVPASLSASTDGTAAVNIGGQVARISDNSGNGLHLTQASTSLRPARGRRAKTGARNTMLNSGNVALYSATNATITTLPAERLGHDMVRVTATAAAGYVNVGFGYPGLLSADVAISVDVRPGTAATVSLTVGGTGNNFSATFDLTTWSATSVSPRIKSTSVVDLGDGWRRLAIVTDDLSSLPVPLIQHSNFPAAIGTYFDVGRAQVEQASAATTYQLTSANGTDIAEDGVESVSFTRFDLVDDALTTGAIAGGLTGQTFVAGDGGCYVSDLSVAAGGAFSIGGTSHNWTGAAPGILRAVSGGTGRVLDMMIREGAYTEDEIARLERYYRALGGKGLLVAGTNLGPALTTYADQAAAVAAGWDVIDPGWTFDAPNDQFVSDVGASPGNVRYVTAPLEVGAFYLLKYEISSSGSINAFIGTANDPKSYITGQTAGVRAAILPAGGGGSYILFRRVTGTPTIKAVELYKLTPREDL